MCSARAAKTALPLGWLATFAVAVGYWRQDALTSCAWALTFFLHRMPWPKVREVLCDVGRQGMGAVVTIGFGVSMAYIYRNTGLHAALTSKSMVYVMAEALAGTFRQAYVAVSPLIGVLGAFMSGSNTVSNMLFASSPASSTVWSPSSCCFSSPESAPGEVRFLLRRGGIRPGAGRLRG